MKVSPSFRFKDNGARTHGEGRESDMGKSAAIQ